ncbi:hypothetical protein B0H13DRAFT_2651219 [Mycena leptocephala]|nr:hypothetical protein B0H13DRAFT_2651219 [Mycena leptocephala]
MSGLAPEDIVFARDQRQTLSLSIAGVGKFKLLLLSLYDYFLTLDLEVAYIWVAPYSRASAWFLFTRYFTFCINFVAVAVMFRNLGAEVCLFQSSACSNFFMAHGLLIIAQQFTVGCTLILRVYAMYNCDKRILILFIMAALVTLGVGTWAVIPVGPTPPVQKSVPGVPGCHTPISRTEAIHIAAAWEAELVCNMIVLGLTLYRTFKKTTSPRPFTDSLWHVMMRAMYFGIICLTNLANILMYYLGDTTTFTSLGAVTSNVSVVLITRVMLNLHAAASLDPDADDATRLGTIRFAYNAQAE